MQKKKDFFEKLGTRLDIPREALPGGYSLFLSGRGELTVRGCRRILAYGDERISLRLSGGVLHIEGRGLLCTTFGGNIATVTGDISLLRLGEEVEK